MTQRAEEQRLSIGFDPAENTAFLQQVRSALQTRSATLVVDMSRVTYLDPQGLEVLRTALQEASAATREVWLDNVQSAVYKALQLAALGALFKRVHHGSG